MQARPAQQYAAHDEASIERERHFAVDSMGEDDPDVDDIHPTHEPAND